MMRWQRHNWQNHGGAPYRDRRDWTRGRAMALAIVGLVVIPLAAIIFQFVPHR